jgi:hypothetical protein
VFVFIYFTFVYSGGLIEVRDFFGKHDLTNGLSKTKYTVLYCPRRLCKQHKIEPHLRTESTEKDLPQSTGGDTEEGSTPLQFTTTEGRDQEGQPALTLVLR